MTLRLRLLSSALALVACSPKSDLTESASDTLGSSSSSSDASTTLNQTTSPPTSDTTPPGQTVTTANPSEPGTISATTAVSETATDGSASDTFPGTVSTVTTGIESTSIGSDSFSTGIVCADAPGQPHNATCTDDSGCGCASGKCFLIPALGGFCSECFTDADCPGGGCTTPNVVTGLGAVCNSGAPGDGCNTDAACNNPAAPICGQVLEVPGILEVTTCGQCETNADCPPQAPHCTPDYTIGDLTGVLRCLPDATVPNDSGCDPFATGDQVCASGSCGEASIMGLIQLGICGECESDSDCDPGQSCSQPSVELDLGLMHGAVCM